MNRKEIRERLASLTFSLEALMYQVKWNKQQMHATWLAIVAARREIRALRRVGREVPTKTV